MASAAPEDRVTTASPTSARTGALERLALPLGLQTGAKHESRPRVRVGGTIAQGGEPLPRPAPRPREGRLRLLGGPGGAAGGASYRAARARPDRHPLLLRGAGASRQPGCERRAAQRGAGLRVRDERGRAAGGPDLRSAVRSLDSSPGGSGPARTRDRSSRPPPPGSRRVGGDPRAGAGSGTGRMVALGPGAATSTSTGSGRGPASRSWPATRGGERPLRALRLGARAVRRRRRHRRPQRRQRLVAQQRARGPGRGGRQVLRDGRRLSARCPGPLPGRQRHRAPGTRVATG